MARDLTLNSPGPLPFSRPLVLAQCKGTLPAFLTPRGALEGDIFLKGFDHIFFLCVYFQLSSFYGIQRYFYVKMC